MRVFDTKVQEMKHRALYEVAHYAWEGTLYENVMDIPRRINPGRKASWRCCVYKERYIFSERLKMAMGGNKDNPNIIEVMEGACDECPAAGYQVTDSCRGCLAHRCMDACKKDAISLDEHFHAHIDKSKCVNCGMCSKVCPFDAIHNHKRPCQKACKVGAITISQGETQECMINYDKCIQCGACVYQCPWGAIADKSFILNAIDLLKDSPDRKNRKVYAVIAPAIAAQFNYAKIGQVVSGLKALGFDEVVEAALGADMVAAKETKELAEKGYLTSSCCPAFVRFIRTAFPEQSEFISHNYSPMAEISKFIKEHNENAKIVFVGPCTAKKAEARLDDVKDYVDVVITFEELQALFDSRSIDITTLEESELSDASYYGRIFGRCGGLSDAVVEGLKELGLNDFELKGLACDGIEECKTALMMKKVGKLDKNFIEGMACIGGCVGGSGNISHSDRNRIVLEKFSKTAGDKTIVGSVEAHQN